MIIPNRFKKFEFISAIGGSHNDNFVLQEKLTKSIWIGKISKKVKGFSDLHNRSLLAYRLGKRIGTCMPATKFIKYKQITPSNIDSILNLQPEIICAQDGLIITKFCGITLNNFLKTSQLNNIINLKQVINNLVFNLWVGNYDKKKQDYVVDNNCHCYSIDYDLCCPGFQSDKNLALGANANGYDINNVDHVNRAIAEPFIDEVKNEKYEIDFFDDEIKKIESFKESRIIKEVNKLSFYWQNTTFSMNEEIVDFLKSRRKKIRPAIEEWLKSMESETSD